MNAYLWVALGGAIGAVMRLGVSRLALAIFGASFPFGTLAVNVIGSLVMGILFASLGGLRSEMAENMRLFLMVGILGGFTTFSAFSLDAFVLYERGDVALAASYIAVSVALSLLALFLGVAIGRALI